MILKINFDSYFGGAYLLHGGKTPLQSPYRADKVVNPEAL